MEVFTTHADITATAAGRCAKEQHRADIVATVVAAQDEPGFISALFGPQRAVAGELAVFNWMSTLCPDHAAGCWQYVQLSNGARYMRPTGNALHPMPRDVALVRLVRGKGRHSLVSRDAAGIVVTLFALNYLIWDGADELDAAYCALREYALGHPENAAILRALV